MNYPPPPPQPVRQVPVWETGQPKVRRRATALGVVSVVAGVGSVAFLAAPRFLVAFAFLVALTGLVCGAVSVYQREGLLGWIGATFGLAMTALYGLVALG